MQERTYAAGAALLIAFVLLWLDAPYWWLGCALAAAGIHLLASDRANGPLKEKWRAWGPLSRDDRIAEAWSIGVLVVITAALLPALLAGDRPVSHDHTLHYFSAWQVTERLLPDGRLLGWSHRLFAGYPANYLYPPGASLWVAGVHAAGLGFVSLSSAYAWAVWLAVFVGAYGTYRFGCAFLGRPVGLLAGVLFLLDLGALRLGGRVWDVEWGVWPMTLALGVAMLALARIPRILEGRGWKPIASGGVLAGFALITHPITLILLPVVGAVALGLRLLLSREEALRAVARSVVTALIAALVASVWLVPFFSTGDYSKRFGMLWASLPEMAVELYEGSFLPGTLWPVLALAALGLAQLIGARGWKPFVPALLVVGLPLVGSTTFLEELHLLEASPAFGALQYVRFGALMKPFLFLAAGQGVRVAVAGVVALRNQQAPSPERRAALTALVALLAAPLLAAVAGEVVLRNVRLPVELERSRQGFAERRALVAWASSLPAPQGLERWALAVGRHDHSFADLATEIDRPFYKIGFTPGETFRYRPESGSNQTLRALNVRYVVSTSTLDRPDLVPAKSFGRLNVYEFKDWRPEPFQVQGTGSARLLAWSDEEVLIEADAAASGRLRLNVSWFPRWSATRNGEPIPVEVRPLEGTDGTGFMEVALAPGLYRFVFRRGIPEIVGLVLFALGLLTAGALFVLDRRLGRAVPALALPFQPKWLSRAQLALGGLAVVALMAGLVGLARWSPAPLNQASAEPNTRVAFDFVDELTRSEVMVLRAGELVGCSRYPGHFACGREAYQKVHAAPAPTSLYSAFRCIQVPALREGQVLLRFEDVPAGDALVGYLAIVGEKESDPVELAIAVDEQIALRASASSTKAATPFELPLPRTGATHDVTFGLDGGRAAGRAVCLNAQVLERHPRP